MRYPYARPNISEEDRKSVNTVLEGYSLTQGPIVQELENSLEECFSVKYAVTCNSGTAALHMVYHALGLGPNAGIVTPALTFLATANAARMCNAPLAFADVDPITGNVTLETVRAAVESVSFKVRIIAVVHLGGRPCQDIVKIEEFAYSIGALVVEDACHAPMASYPDRNGRFSLVGNCAHSIAATLSFHAIKHITTGEGGVVLTNDQSLAESARLFRSHGVVRDHSKMKNIQYANAPWYYEMHELGYNYRLSEINCALGLSQLSKLKESIEKRQAIAEMYNHYLVDVSFMSLPSISHKHFGTHAWHLYAPAFDFNSIGKSRECVMKELALKGVGSQVHYIPLYYQPYYSPYVSKVQFQGTEHYYKRTLSLPMYPNLTEEDIKIISDCVRSTIER